MLVETLRAFRVLRTAHDCGGGLWLHEEAATAADQDHLVWPGGRAHVRHGARGGPYPDDFKLLLPNAGRHNGS